jgi:hypothetical protein
VNSANAKKVLIWTAVALAAVFVLATVPGCGSGSGTGVSGGEIYGVPVYPGAVKVADTTLGPDSAPQISALQATFHSADPYQKVSAWYKLKLSAKPGYAEQKTPLKAQDGTTTEVATYTFRPGNTVRVATIWADKDKTTGTNIRIIQPPEGPPQ